MEPWPKDKYITCYGFSKEILPLLKRAIDGKMVVWGKSTGFCAAFTTEFEWAGCKWSVDEMNEYITSFTLLKGTPDPESLTAALLKGTIESS